MAVDSLAPNAVRETGARFRLYDFVRLITAAILIVAAFLKAYELSTEPVADQGILSFRWSLSISVLAEFVLGAWLLSGLAKRACWKVAVATFTLFTGITLYKLVDGASTCGCFGKLSPHPAYTLAIDVFFLGSLLLARPNAQSPQPVSNRLRRLAIIAFACLAFCVPAAFAMFTYEPATITDDGTIIGDQRFVLLEPENWLGKPFPLTKYIDIGQDLTSGSWIAILYHHDCPNCRSELPKVMIKAAGDAARKPGTRVAVIEMPRYAGIGESITMPPKVTYREGRLSDQRDWFVMTPTVLDLSDGIVMSSKESDGPVRIASAVTAGKPTSPVGSDKSAVEPTIVTLEHDFGFVQPDSKHKTTFRVNNSLGRVVAITEVKSECKGCVVPKPPKSIPAGATVDVQVDFSAPKAAMSYAKRIVMKTDDPARPIIVLKVMAQVGMPLAIQPKEIDLGTLKAGQDRRAELVLVNHANEPIHPIYGISSVQGLIVQVPRGAIPAQGRLVIPLKIDSRKLSGQGAANIRIFTDCPTQSSVEATVRYAVEPSARAPA